jgi:DNA-binding Lrp family transcriptional regulator
MYKIDSIDKQILRIIQKNAKASTKEIAFRVGLSTTPVFERIKRLEKNGIITHYSAILNKEKIGLSLTVFCQVSLQTHTKDLIEKFEIAVNNMEEVHDVYHVAGDFDYLLKVVLRDNRQYHDFLIDKLSQLNIISNVQSNFVLNKPKEFIAYSF